ncbi:MAG TPA: arsenate reductase ArsC [Sedimentisphaerales bacterium]|nr:arsenate reductase ArsC [Sedimentisphaerales bacterium]
MVEKKNVLFICTGNSCRSQMAQGWASYLRGDEIEAFSAGVAPARLSSRAVEVMSEAGVDISKHYSKHIDDLPGIDFDLVVTVCDNAKEQCPIWSGKTKVIHHSFDDPTGAIGTVDFVMSEFRRVRDEIRDFIKVLEV